MRKAMLFLLLGIATLFAGEVYSDQVKALYADSSSNKVIGKLLPTNAVTIKQKVDGRVQITLRGYRNPAVPNVIYFNETTRILVAAFAKSATFEVKEITPAKEGGFPLVEVSVYTDDGGFSENVGSIFSKAADIYKEGCGICHALHETTHYKANQWPGLLKSMLSRTAINKEDEMLVVQYLQKHSADVKVK